MKRENLRAWWQELVDADLSTTEFTDRAVATTIAFCRDNVPYYRERFAGLPPVTALADLAGYPLLDPAVLGGYYHPVRTDGVPTDFVVFSGGTSGAGKFLHRAFAEYEPLQYFRDRYLPHDMGYSWQHTPPELRVALFDGLHGIRYIENRRGPLKVLYVPLVQEGHGATVRRTLADLAGSGSADGVATELWGSHAKLRILTRMAAEESWADAPDLKRIFFGGYFMPAAAQEELTATWKAALVPTYGQTEFHQAYSARCGTCGWNHFERVVAAEFVGLEDTAPVTRGPARLLLTHLVPTALRQILIRYDTQDVVEVGGICAGAGARQWRLIGRDRQVVHVADQAGRTVAVGPTPFLEAATQETGLRIVPVDPMHHQSRFADLGLPAIAIDVSHDRGLPTVTIAAEARKEAPATDRRSMAERLTERSLADARLAELVRHGRIHLDVRVVAPGCLPAALGG